MAIMVGSARHDENGKYTGGKAGDSLQKSSSNDTVGEVSMQNMYAHSKGWYIIRPKSDEVASKLAAAMTTACNNSNIGYNQSERTQVVSAGTATKKKVNADCSSLVRTCVKESSGKDPGNFTTANEASKLAATGLFQDKIKYVSQTKTPVYNGDILVTCSKGHTVIVVSGSLRPVAKSDTSSTTSKPSVSYYSKYTGTSSSLTTALAAVGEKDTSYTHRKKIAAANSVSGYSGTAAQNTSLLNLLKKGKLIKA